VIARELTKVHEEFLRGTAGELAEQIRDREVKGEITILIGKAVSGEKISGVVDMRARLREIMRQQNLDEKAALKVLAKERGVSKSEVYREVQRSTKSPKR
jgi:16S rRNA (cytidine1402-2'-O)-methyltransferase